MPSGALRSAPLRREGYQRAAENDSPAGVGVRSGDPVVAPETLDAVPVVHAPTEGHDDLEFRETCFPILDSPE